MLANSTCRIQLFLSFLTFNNSKNATQIQQFLVTFNSFVCFEWRNWWATKLLLVSGTIRMSSDPKHSSNCCQLSWKHKLKRQRENTIDLAFASTSYTAMALHKWDRGMCESVAETLTLKHLFVFEWHLILSNGAGSCWVIISQLKLAAKLKWNVQCPKLLLGITSLFQQSEAKWKWHFVAALSYFLSLSLWNNSGMAALQNTEQRPNLNYNIAYF